MDNQEIAMHLTVASVKWLQEQKGSGFEGNAEYLGSTVGSLYQSILRGIAIPLSNGK